MRSLAVVGVETPVGAAAMVHFDGTAEVVGVRLEEVAAVGDLCQTCTDIIVCGDASLSSWDEQFGQLSRDARLLARYVRMAAEAGVRLVYISSDAVFDGPWVFHDDDSSAFSASRCSRQLQSLEACVLKVPQNLVIRTNALSDVPGAWLDQLTQSFRQQTAQHLNARQFATPLAASRLALLLDHILMTAASGVVHVAGAERLSPWLFGQELARVSSASFQSVLPLNGQQPCERSLRCTRARREFRLRMPTLSQTITELTVDSSVVRRAA